MKRLSNISPFILLLVPVFIMMLLTLASTDSSKIQNEAALKTGKMLLVKSTTALESRR